MDTTNPDPDAPLPNRFRPLFFVAAAALFVIAGVFGLSQLRDTTSTTEVADTPGNVESTPTQDQAVPILIPDEFNVLNPVETVEPFEREIVGPDLAGTLCDSGLEARHPDLFPWPAEQASALSIDPRATLDYTRFVFDTPEEAAAVIEMWGDGYCEATVNIVDGVPTNEGTILFPDQPVDIPLPAAFDAAAVQLEVGGGIAVGILVVRSGAEIVLVVTVDPPDSEQIPAILETVASAYG